jgi:hypothetical protein
MLAITVSKNYELTEAQAQALVNFEAMLADLGLIFWLYCRQCHMIGDPKDVEGYTGTNDDGTMTFKVSCKCSERVYRGHLVAPPAPRPLRSPRVDLDVRPEVPLDRTHMARWQAASDVLHQLRLVYSMRCLACRQENRDTDGVWGNSERTSGEFAVECACSRRVYKGSDAPLAH